MSEYKRYLKSVSWKNIRNKALIRDKFICQDCFLHEAKEVHHLTYENIGFEKMEDLISLCPVCHGKRHKIERPFYVEVGYEPFLSYEHMVECEISRLIEKDP